MRIPNLNVSGNVTNTIRELDQQRFKLDRQISTGQKITYPEDDGIKAGRLIQAEALKENLLSTSAMHLTHLSSLTQDT